jgi:hypothetical protein
MPPYRGTHEMTFVKPNPDWLGVVRVCASPVGLGIPETSKGTGGVAGT